jgi:hypothetical protein
MTYYFKPTKVFSSKEIKLVQIQASKHSQHVFSVPFAMEPATLLANVPTKVALPVATAQPGKIFS